MHSQTFSTHYHFPAFLYLLLITTSLYIYIYIPFTLTHPQVKAAMIKEDLEEFASMKMGPWKKNGAQLLSAVGECLSQEDQIYFNKLFGVEKTGIYVNV